MEQVMLDMIPTGAKAVCHVSQYDIGRTIRFNLISGGAAYTLSGTETVKVYIKKPDGTTAERNIANTSSTYVDWVTGEGDCDQAGECECELVITSGTTVIGSKNFTVKIEEDPYNEQGVVTETAGPAIIATFTTNVVDLLKEVKCSIKPIQNGTPWIDSNEINKEPYIKRAVAGTATRIGNHLYDKLVGGTVAFNQMVQNGNFASAEGWAPYDGTKTVLSVSNNEATITFLSSGSGYVYGLRTSVQRHTANHKYLASVDLYVNKAGEYGIDADGGRQNKTGVITANSWVNFAKIYNANGQNTTSFIILSVDRLETDDYIKAKNVYLVDLTAMFGSTIADYIYGLEQATAGAGVAWFKALFPNDYYAYNAGELMSVKATAHVMKNASNQVIGNYALDSNLVLNGLFKLDANNKLYADGDTYESSGDVGRKYALVNLGTCEYSKTTVGSYEIFYTTITDKASSTDGLCIDYVNSQNGRDSLSDKQFGVYNMTDEGKKIICIRDDSKSSMSTNDFKTAMSGKYLLYEKATHTTEQATPFTNPQVCDENGTEEYTDNRAVAIPVGHETYQANICPITGFDELNITRCGVNLISNNDSELPKTSNGVSFSQEADGSYTVVASAEKTGYPFVRIGRVALPKGTYSLSTVTGISGISFRAVDRTVSPPVVYGDTFTLTEDKPNLTIEIATTTATLNVGTYNLVGMLNIGSALLPYRPYSGKLIKLEFDDTVYLAEVSCLNGVWKLKLLGAEVDLDTLTSSDITKIDAYAGLFFIKSSVIKTNWGMLINSDTVCICDEYAYSGTISGGNGDAYNKGNSTMTLRYEEGDERLYIRDDRCSTVAELLTAIATTKLVYPLATPIEITLDETEQFETLLGVNNVWHDGNGNTEVKYLYNA